MAIEPEQAMGGGPEPQPPVGLINKPQSAPPQEGGEKSVADDVSMKADEGDYVLPYETVLLVGLKDLNRYAKEAIDLAMANNVDLGGTDLDPTDDVPIKISNYEYHIPKQLVPFFGGGKKYLDKIREEGLSLRKRLAEEGGKKKEGAPPPQQAEAPAPPPPPPPPQEQAFAGGQPAPPPDMPPPSPPMQKGGFVLSKDKEANILEKDAPQSAEQQRTITQQPPMITPEGKKVQQGFSAPMGYQAGSEVQELNKTSQQAAPEKAVPDWVKRALDPSSPVQENDDGSISSVRTESSEVNGKILLYPTLRKQGEKLVKSGLGDALKKEDYMTFNTEDDATAYSKHLSNQIFGMRNLQKASGGFVRK